MKCICGYEYIFDYENQKVVKGERFFQFYLSFPTMEYLYVCPECGTVKMDLSKCKNHLK